MFEYQTGRVRLRPSSSLHHLHSDKLLSTKDGINQKPNGVAQEVHGTAESPPSARR